MMVKILISNTGEKSIQNLFRYFCNFAYYGQQNVDGNKIGEFSELMIVSISLY